MGSINGSAVANVATTGIFTIPLMKKTGLSASLSGAIEAVASTGGQLMPPVMGASAFVLAELVGIPYIEVVKAALIPALAYYVSLYFMLDLYARQAGLVQKKTNFKLPDEKILKKIHLLLPLIVLIYFIITSASLQRAAVASIIATVIISWIRKETRIYPGRTMEALAEGARQALSVSIPCATAGILIGIVGYTGIGLRLSSLIIAVSGGFLFLAMILVMIGTIILGMGMPTSGAYITAAVLLAPALSELGISQLGAHLFIFFFAALSMVTPPVGLASYAAATISGANLTETGLLALRLALAGFIVPFAFAINPILLMQGSIPSILWSSGTLFVGVMALGTSLVGFLFNPLALPIRILLSGSAILLIVPERLTDLAGAILLAGVLYREFLFKRSENIPKDT
jgi:TRAP transporter 4TM/12TM fusion protein